MLPRLSSMSISPEAGQSPYALLWGNSQMAGQSQFPSGVLAWTSSRPYLIVCFPAVVSLAELTGLKKDPLVEFRLATQSLSV